MTVAGLSREVTQNLEKGSWIRKLFDEGARLKKEFGADKVFDFSIGNPVAEPPETFKKALCEAADGTDTYKTKGFRRREKRLPAFCQSGFRQKFPPGIQL